MCSIAEQPASTAQLTGLNLETYADPAGHEALLHQRTREERQRQDPNDRRRVLVELTPATHEIAHSFYAPHMAEAERLLHRYMLEQLEHVAVQEPLGLGHVRGVEGVRDLARRGRQLHQHAAAVVRILPLTF